MSEWEQIKISVCTTCIVVMSNGCETPEDKACAVLMAEGWPAPWTLVATGEDEEGWFSWQQCEGCGEVLGGQRYNAVAMRQI